MKVALIRQQYNPYGGAEKFVNIALQSLRRVGAEPVVICNQWADQHASNANDVVQLPRVRAFTRQGNSAAFAAQVQTYLARHTMDLVQTHERIPGFDVFRAGDGLHKTWLSRRTANSSWWRKKLTAIDPYHRSLLALEKELLEHPQLKSIICNSAMVQNEILAHYAVDPRKITIIRNGVDTKYYRPPTEQERLNVKNLLSVGQHQKVFTYVGSGFERKGVMPLLRAMALLPEAFLFVVGADKHLKKYQQVAKSLKVDHRVRFTGPQKNVRDYYWAADAMVFPTLYDPCPNAVLEAMACGLGVTTTPYCGALELLTPGQSATTCSPWSHEEVANAMQFFLQTDQAQLAGRLARQAVEPYTIDNMGQELMSLYQRILQR